MVIEAVRAEALCGSDLRLRGIVRHTFNGGASLLKWHHMEEWHPLKVGVIGMPGSGKSGALAVISFVEDMLDERPVWSNMGISVPVQVSDHLAQEYGLPRGGTVEYSAIPLSVKKMLAFEYRNGAMVVDEINVKLAEARRSQSNSNRWFNELDQQLRKLHCPLYYSVIHEMWIDNRLRDMTDIFIKCEDPAFTVKGLRDKKRPGVDSNWYLYDMHGYRTGLPYSVSHKIYGPIPFHLKDWWGTWNTEQFQSTGAGKYAIDMDEAEEGEAPENEFAWLDQALTDIMAECQDRGMERISGQELLTRLEVPKELKKVVKVELKERLNYIGYSAGLDYFKVPESKLRYDDTTVASFEDWKASDSGRERVPAVS